MLNPCWSSNKYKTQLVRSTPSNNKLYSIRSVEFWLDISLPNNMIALSSHPKESMLRNEKIILKWEGNCSSNWIKSFSLEKVFYTWLQYVTIFEHIKSIYTEFCSCYNIFNFVQDSNASASFILIITFSSSSRNPIFLFLCFYFRTWTF